jgi:Domain of unknown function (DUF4249)
MKWFIYILIGFTTLSCIEEIRFDSEDVDGALVVDGFANAGQGPHVLKLSRTADLRRSVFPTVDNALVYLVSGVGSRTEYNFVGEGEYEIDSGLVEILHGEKYWIEIQTEGSTYISEPEIVPSLVAADSSWFVINGGYIEVWVGNSKPDIDRVFLKWNVTNYFAFTELRWSPLASPKTCYVIQPFNPQVIPLFDASRIMANGRYDIMLGEKFIDELFGNPQSFLIEQQSLSQNAFEYYSRLNLVSSQSGSIFDAQPASVAGNVSNINDPDEQVFGYFSCVATDTTLFFTYRGDFIPKIDVLPYCGAAGFPVFEDECCQCLLYRNSIAEKPDYWP